MSNQEKVLIVDDEPYILDGYYRGLYKEFSLSTARSALEALEMIENEGPYAVVITDMCMPVMDGLTFLIRLNESHPEIVRIMLTGNADQKTAEDAVNKGHIFQFLSKPCNRETIATAINDGLIKFAASKEKEARYNYQIKHTNTLEKLFLHQKKHDFLTGLANRKTFENSLRVALDITHMHDSEHTLCYLDVDHFHVINDVCGIAAGDELLHQLSKVLTECYRTSDRLARMGGDQFCVLLNDTHLQDGQKVIKHFVDKIEKFRFLWGSKEHKISFSIGILPLTVDCSDVSSVLAQVETACNIAREKGPGSIHIARSGDDELSNRLNNIQWVTRIEEAIQNNNFRLCQQTIVPLNPDINIGEHYEVLLRLYDDKQQLVSPDVFLPVAENYHLAPDIDCWVIETMAKWLSCDPQRYKKLSLCSINLSGLSMGNEKVLSCILDSFDKFDIKNEQICFEVTETAAIADLNKALGFMTELISHGFRFSLDDFGSGLSSFFYLKNLPVDFVKIDGEFVENIALDNTNYVMVKAITEVAHAMGKKVIAEYVETEEIRDCLRTLNVDFAQGYFYAKPRLFDS